MKSFIFPLFINVLAHESFYPSSIYDAKESVPLKSVRGFHKHAVNQPVMS